MTHSLRRMVLSVIFCAATWFATASGQQPAVQSARHVADEAIVQYNPQSPISRRDAVIARRGGRVLHRLENIDRVRLATGAAVDAEIAALENDPDVEAAQPNFIREMMLVPNDPYWTSNSLWGLLKIQAPSAWTISTGSQQVVVADIDTGVNYSHPDLAQNMWRNPGEIAGNRIDDDANGYVDDVYGIDPYNGDSDPMDDHSHGSHTAGTIGAIGNNGVGVAGVNWNVRILACKAFNASGSGTDWAAIQCFNYITALKKKGINIRVSSNSWGSARGAGVPTALKSAIDAAGNAGIVNACAAGNAGTNNDTTPFDPASLDSASIVSVAASDSLDGRASFSNYGPTSVDIAAPGVSILSTGITGYVTKSGTSMATPHVAGVAALVSGLKPGLTPAGLRALLMNSVDLRPAWSSVVASGGRLNAYLAALDAGGDIAPTVSLTSPVNGSTFTAPATTTVTASASDADGTINKVNFYANGVLIGSDTTSPYSALWSGVSAGQYTLTAVATDDRQFETTSATVTVTVNAATTNAAPTVSAGPDRIITLPATAGLQGSASDDGKPSPPGTMTLRWTRFSGPGTATFSAPTAAVTSASFSAPGTYVLQLTASDSVLSRTDNVTVTVNAATTNAAPTVSAGPDRIITLPSTASLQGSASDDGKPSPPGAMTLRWTRFSGPGTVTFSAPTAAVTSASFTVPGTYVLQLTASDSVLSRTDYVTVTVNAATTNAAPTVSAGPDRIITLPSTASLQGSASDDGKPSPPGAMTLRWTRFSGPGTVTFSAPTAAVTSASFAVPGTYVLQLTASDSVLSRTDYVTVTVNAATKKRGPR